MPIADRREELKQEPKPYRYGNQPVTGEDYLQMEGAKQERRGKNILKRTKQGVTPKNTADYADEYDQLDEEDDPKPRFIKQFSGR